MKSWHNADLVAVIRWYRTNGEAQASEFYKLTADCLQELLEIRTALGSYKPINTDNLVRTGSAKPADHLGNIEKKGG